MDERLRRAEEEVAAARADVAADLDGLRGWITGATPLMRALNVTPRFRRQHQRHTGLCGDRSPPLRSRPGEGARVNPLPFLLIALGAGWLTTKALRRVGQADVRAETATDKVSHGF